MSRGNVHAMTVQGLEDKCLALLVTAIDFARSTDEVSYNW